MTDSFTLDDIDSPTIPQDPASVLSWVDLQARFVDGTSAIYEGIASGELDDVIALLYHDDIVKRVAQLSPGDLESYETWYDVDPSDGGPGECHCHGACWCTAPRHVEDIQDRLEWLERVTVGGPIIAWRLIPHGTTGSTALNGRVNGFDLCSDVSHEDIVVCGFDDILGLPFA